MILSTVTTVRWCNLRNTGESLFLLHSFLNGHASHQRLKGSLTGSHYTACESAAALNTFAHWHVYSWPPEWAVSWLPVPPTLHRRPLAVLPSQGWRCRPALGCLRCPLSCLPLTPHQGSSRRRRAPCQTRGRSMSATGSAKVNRELLVCHIELQYCAVSRCLHRKRTRIWSRQLACRCIGVHPVSCSLLRGFSHADGRCPASRQQGPQQSLPGQLGYDSVWKLNTVLSIVSVWFFFHTPAFICMVGVLHGWAFFSERTPKRSRPERKTTHTCHL